jgi:Cu2+-exporting ATPase
VRDTQTQQGHQIGMVALGVTGHNLLLNMADRGFSVAGVETADVILVRSNPLDVVAILKLSRATYRKMIQNLFWATGYNTFAIPLAAGALSAWGLLLTPALGAMLMSASTVIVATNARLLKLRKSPSC